MKPNCMVRIVVVACILVLANEASSQSLPQSGNVIVIDASRTEPLALTDIPLRGTTPTGHTIAVNNRYLTKDGEPWLPVMGEFHYSRYPDKYWEEELQKMKAGGVQIVATYVFWNHHEEVEGEFDWSGQRNLRRFIELAAQNNLYVWLRIGPYGHGEVRNGGLPDWIFKKGKTRSNDPQYLSFVNRYFNELGRQVHGLFWKDGGPIIGVQLENEYYAHGPDAGAAHIRELKRIANQAGIVAPLYTVTGWGDPDFPAGEVIPVFGGYPDNFWESTLTELAPSGFYQFDFTGASLKSTEEPTTGGAAKSQTYPFFMAEAGGGMQVAYHRRPRISGDDVAAMTLTRLGSGANLFGYYMYQGGANPAGKLTTLQESVGTDRVYDLPVVTYDFQAPLGQFGQMNEPFRATKPFHLFLADFGSQLAPMVPVPPQRIPADANDRATPRVAARVAGNRAFLFFNNYQRSYPLPEHKQLQIDLKLPGETLRIPSTPIDVAPGAYFIWPVNLDLNGALLKYASAQLLTKVRDGQEDYYFFFQQPGIAPEFAFDERTLQDVKAPGAAVAHANGTAYVRGLGTGTSAAITLRSKNDTVSRIVLLSGQQAREAWKASVENREYVMLSPADVFVAKDGVHLRARDVNKLHVSVFPALKFKLSASPTATKTHDGLFARFAFSVRPKGVPIHWGKARAAAPSEPIKKGEHNAIAPTDADFDRAGVWNVEVPNDALTGLSDLFLRIRYIGDIARLYKDKRLLMDDFYNGNIWEIGLKRFAPEISAKSLDIEIMPLRKDAPIYLPAESWPQFPKSGEIANILEITAHPEYEVIFLTEPNIK